MVVPGPVSDHRGPSQNGTRTQFECLRWDLRAICRGRRVRWWTAIFSEGFLTVAFYRLNRAAYQRFGRGWSAVRAVLAPLNPIVRLLVPTDLDYRADIDAGLRILHPQLGVVVAPGVIAGTGLVLAGGNAVGAGAPVLGDDVHLGVNAVIIGDVKIGARVRVGAGAVVVKDFEGPGTLVGVPARAVETAAGAGAGPPARSTYQAADR